MDSGRVRLLVTLHQETDSCWGSVPFPLLFSPQTSVHGMTLPTFSQITISDILLTHIHLPSPVAPLWKPPQSQSEVCLLGNSKSIQVGKDLIITGQSTCLSLRLPTVLCKLHALLFVWGRGKGLFPGHCRLPASRSLTQKEVTGVCPGEALQTKPAGCGRRISETSVSTPGPSLPEDDVFLREAKTPSPQDSQGLPTSTSYRQYENDLSKKAGQIAVSAERPLHETPGITGTEDCGQAVNGSVDLSRPTSIPETTNDDIPTFDTNGTTDPSAATEKKPLKPPPVDVLRPSDSETPGSPHHTSLTWGQFDSKTTWPSRHFEALVQELARLDPSLSRTLAAQPGPEPPQGLLDGLFPVEEIRSAMRPALEEMGEKAAGASEEGSCGHHLTQDLQTSQEASRSENSTPDPDQSSGQEFPEGNSTQAKKVELARLLQKMLQDLHAEQERLRGTAADWTQRNGALEAAVSQACTPRELERFRRFMTDLERVLGLLLLLGSRLVRVNLALARAGSNSDPDERASLLQRLQLLQRQQEEAKELKEHVARREQTLRQVLERELPAEHLRSYCVLLASKARILSQQRSLDDRIRFLKDQLDTIWSDLSHHPLSPRLTWAPAIRPLNKQPFLATLI